MVETGGEVRCSSVHYRPHYSLGSRAGLTEAQYVSEEHTKRAAGRSSPGPVYDTRTKVGAGRKSSFGLRLGSWAKDAERSPGPVYNLGGSIISTPSYSITSGPQRLDPGTQIVSKTHSLHDQYARESPGPIYDIPSTLCQDGPKFSFAPKDRNHLRPYSAPVSHHDEESPGPGAYEPYTSVGVGPRWAFAGKPATDQQYTYMGEAYCAKTNIGKHGPGPGSYSPQDRQLGLNTPMYTFHGGPKPARPKSAVAAPGQGTPGPGAYNAGPTVGVKYGPRTKFGTGERNNNIKSDSPGPATYGPWSTVGIGPHHIVGTGGRYVPPKDEVPGPGAYPPGAKSQGPEFGFGTQTRDRDKVRYIGKELIQDSVGTDSPGPASYVHEGAIGKEHFGQSTSVKIGTSQRSEFTKDARRLPGPGAYAPKNKLFGDSVGTTFGNSHRERVSKEKFPRARYIAKGFEKENVSRDSPGPACYNLPSSFATNKGCSFGISYREQSERARFLSNELAKTDLYAKSSPGPAAVSQIVAPARKWH